MNVTEDPIFEPLLIVQTALQDLTPKTLSNAISIISDFISKFPDHKLAIIRSIYNISETKYSCIDQFVDLIKSLQLEEDIQQHLFFGFSHDSLFFIQALIRAGLATQYSYDKVLLYGLYAEKYKENYNGLYNEYNPDVALELSSIIDNDNVAQDEVSIGKTVVFKELPDGEEEEYTIVGSTEVDLSQNKISNESPIAKALIGKKVKDVVEVEAPSGVIKMKILKISK